MPKVICIIATAIAMLLAGCDAACGKDCKNGKPCGCSCIEKSKTCHKADDGSEWFEPDAELPDDAVLPPESP